MKTVATMDIGQEAAGIDFYKTESPGSKSAKTNP
jgi:hypothetical protein